MASSLSIFRVLDGLEKPILWVFPKVPICLACGFAEFAVPERELRVLATGAPIEGVTVQLNRDRQSGDN